MARTVFNLAGVSVGTLLACSAVTAASNVILPRRGIGQIRLGETFKAVTRVLKQPTGGGDTATGRSWETWGGVPSGPIAEENTSVDPGPPKRTKKAELDVYTDIYAHYPNGRPNPDNLPLVEQVRVTSPWFRTKRGVGVGSRLGQLRALYRSQSGEPRRCWCTA